MKAAHVLVIIMSITSLMIAFPSAATSKPTWEQKWETTLADAKKEGKVSVYTVWIHEVITPLRQAFKEKYGIELEFTPLGRSSTLLPKVQAENAAGLHVVDAFGCGGHTLVSAMKPAKVLGPLEPLLILPEVSDPNIWSGGQFPFVDKDRLVIGMLATIERTISYNTNLIKQGEITSYKDLLRTQYKGKIAMSDPTLRGTVNAMFTHLAYNVWNLEEASEFLRLLIKQQEVVVQSDNRLVSEWVARGKYPLGVGGHQPTVIRFMNAGAPINFVVMKEAVLVDVAGSGLAVPPVLPHPNAASIFVNWILTKEGQTLFSKGYGYPSRRLDVPTEGFQPTCILSPDEKASFITENIIMLTDTMREVAKKIITGR